MNVVDGPKYVRYRGTERPIPRKGKTDCARLGTKAAATETLTSTESYFLGARVMLRHSSIQAR